jgi:hypothetical protein
MSFLKRIPLNLRRQAQAKDFPFGKSPEYQALEDVINHWLPAPFARG